MTHRLDDRAEATRGAWQRRTGMAVFVLLAATCAFPADPFYERRLRQGTDAYGAGDYGRAVAELRTAVFGLLEEPELLAHGLCQLALAEKADGDPEAFRITFLRVLEIEERFGAYTKSGIPQDLRSEFERVAAEFVPAATLNAHPTFAGLVDLQIERGLERLSTKARRAELARLMVERSGTARWPLLLAQQDLNEGKAEEAVIHASKALTLEPGNSHARLFRGMAYAAEGRWLEALSDLVASGRAGETAGSAEQLLRAFMETDLLEDAVEFADTLSPAIHRQGAVARLTREIQEQLRRRPQDR